MLAQQARITVRASDPAGGVVPQASVVISNTNTGVTRETASNEQGYFTMPSPAPGI